MFATDAFFNTDEFAVTGVLDGAAVVGILDKGYALGAVGMVGMAGSQPVFTCPTPAGDPVGQLLIVGTDRYVVAAHEPDGTGVSRLLLEVSA